MSNTKRYQIALSLFPGVVDVIGKNWQPIVAVQKKKK